MRRTLKESMEPINEAGPAGPTSAARMIDDEEIGFDAMLEMEEEAEEAWQEYLAEPIEEFEGVNCEQECLEEEQDREMERQFWDEGGHLSWDQLSRVLVGSAEETVGRGKVNTLGVPYSTEDLAHIEQVEKQIADLWERNRKRQGSSECKGLRREMFLTRKQLSI